MDKNIESDDSCFCCGKGNERGLHFEFEYPEPGRAECSFVIPEWCAGWKGVTHGGFLSMFLDELMAHACISHVATAVTASMSVSFSRPVATGSRIRVVGAAEAPRGRIIDAKGWIYGEDGELKVQATAKFIVTERKKD